MRNIHILLSFTLILLASCGGKGKSFEHAGGTFAYAISHEPATLVARKITDVYSASVVYQVLEGLTCLDPNTLKPQPSLAESWSISEDGLTVTFDIKKGVYFHNNTITGSQRELVPSDILYSIELACTAVIGEEPSSAYSGIYKDLIEGAEDFYLGNTDHISGLVINGNQLIMKLMRPDASFLDKLASANTSVVLREAVEAGRETDLIGTGPFIFKQYRDVDDNTEIVLVRNENYHQLDIAGNQLPYLDTLLFVVESRSLRQLEMFEEGRIQLIEGLPPSRITSMLEGRMDDFNSSPPRLMLKRKPLLATQYYEFNMLYEPFQDVKVRKAINYAVDRDDIIRNVLNNQAHSAGVAGIIPPAAFSGYDSKGVKEKGYSFNPEMAKKLLAEAGYPNGEGFPTIELKFNLGSIHSAVADQFAKHMKKYLNINVNIDGLSFEDKLASQINARGQITRTSWYADYYSPETFLMNMYGKYVPEDPNEPSLLNLSRYKNDAFDRAVEMGSASKDIAERYKYFAEAEKIMMDDAPIIVLWYEETIKITYSKVRNLRLNEMNYYQFKDVYIKEWTEEEFRASTENKK
jgi:ABC-type transport system substrate-binding protein